MCFTFKKQDISDIVFAQNKQIKILTESSHVFRQPVDHKPAQKILHNFDS